MADLIQRLLDLILRLFRRNGPRPEELPAPPTDQPPETEPEADPDDTTAGEPVEDEPTPPTDGGDKGDSQMSIRPTLERGSTDRTVVQEAQGLLNRNGAKLKVDGDFGPGTEGAVEELQRSYGLMPTGVIDEDVWEILDRPWFNQDPKFQDVGMAPPVLADGSSYVAKGWNAYGGLLGVLSEVLGIKPSASAAVLAVESAGEGFWDGRMVIRFENHIFKKYWGKANLEIFNSHFKTDPQKVWLDHEWRDGPGPWRKLHTQEGGQNEEWAVFEFASSIDQDAALRSISMGAPQIMGFNYAKCGFDTPGQMFDTFIKGDRPHVCGLFDFIRSDHMMVRALRTEDWAAFAHIYNGSGQADYYGGKIGENVDRARALSIP